MNLKTNFLCTVMARINIYPWMLLQPGCLNPTVTPKKQGFTGSLLRSSGFMYRPLCQSIKKIQTYWIESLIWTVVIWLWRLLDLNVITLVIRRLTDTCTGVEMMRLKACQHLIFSIIWWNLISVLCVYLQVHVTIKSDINHWIKNTMKELSLSWKCVTTPNLS